MRLIRRFVLRVRPLTMTYHQLQDVRAWGPSILAARRYARLGEGYRALRWPNGSAPDWQNHRFRDRAALARTRAAARRRRPAPAALGYAAMLATGDPIPEATVWTAPRQSASLRTLLGGRPALVLFYLFDWSAT